MNRRNFVRIVSSGSLISLSGCIGPLDGIFSDNEVNKNKIQKISPPINKTVINNNHNIDSPMTGNWNPHYLGENLDRRKDITYDVLDVSTVQDGILDMRNRKNANEFAVKQIRNTNQESQIFEESINVDYENKNILLIESGYVNENYKHKWVGSEKIGENAYRIFGYYRIPPLDVTGELSKISSVLRVPKRNEYTVTLTVNQSVSVNFSTYEDIVTIEEL